LGLGITSACFSFRLRHDKRGVAIVALALITVAAFQRSMGNMGNDILIGILVLAISTGAVCGIWGERANED
jgi:protein-S-isoprenylcysteine O-methyltransferase Ste14